MQRKLLSTAVFLFIISIFTGNVCAAEFTVFGPVTFERGKGKPAAETAAFAGPAGGQDFMLKIINGDDQGKNRVSAASVTLNGSQLVKTSDFNQQTAEIVKPVFLESNNELSVIIEGIPGSFITINITGTSLEPSVSFSISPETVQAGQSAVLTWNTVNAETCSINQEIGSVPLSGTMTVTPAQTMTYTLTAANSSGTASAQAGITVIQPAPTVSISAQPQSVYAGEPVTLTWNSINAATAVIDQEVGEVQANGSIAVNPMETTGYTVTVTGPGGTASADITVNVVSPISIQITSPLDGSLINTPYTIVTGTVSNDTDNETIVIVNEMPAILSGNSFAANHVPLHDGDNTIIVKAVDTAENIYETDITVFRIPSENHIMLLPDSTSGVSTFETGLKIESSFSISNSDISYTGPGLIEIIKKTPTEYTININVSGIYYLTANAWDSSGNIYTDIIAVSVIAPAELDALLRAKWEGMKNNLASGNIEGAVKYFFLLTREKYTQIFTAIGSDLPGFAAQMEDIEPVYMRESLVKYRIKRDELINGETVKITYYIYFSKGPGGLWYIDSF